MIDLDAAEHESPARPWMVAIALAAKDVRRGVRSKSLVLTAVVGPLVLGLIMALAFGGANGPSATIAVVDLDATATSEGVVAVLGDQLSGGPVSLRTDLRDAEEAVIAEEVDAALVIPPGYTKSLFDQPLALQVVRNNQRAIPGEVATAIAGELASQSDLIRAATSTVVAIDQTQPPLADVREIRPAITVDIGDLQNSFNAALYFGPLTIFLFLGLGGAARSLVREEREGTLARIRSIAVSPRTLTSGSAIGVFIQGVLASLVVYAVSTVAFGARWGEPAEVILVLLALVAALSGLSTVITAASRTEAQAEGWTNACAFLFGIIGGSFFGGAQFPGVLGVVGAYTPNALAMRALIELGPGGQDLASVLPILAALVAAGIAAFAVGSQLMTRRFG
ncbi:MAG: ABC transporter permease [Actinobacteria bacterium]|nr:ABC transporter permease [Actinomycetota bacterium]